MQRHTPPPTETFKVQARTAPVARVLFNFKAPPEVDLYLGTTLTSDTHEYKIKKLINQGGMGSVYKAEAPGQKEPIAIKFLHRRFVGEDEGNYVKRFEREAAALSLINHENVVKTLGFGITEKDVYVVMECLAGKGLDSIISEYRHKRKPMPWDRISKILMQVCDGVAAAHAKKIWHRDIKPSNVIVMKNDRVKLIDFGTAKLPDFTTITNTDVAVGTFAYMAPEMLSDVPYDHRGDVYSIGAMMYEMLSNSKLFRST